jgi:hypothetical protein
MLSDKIMEPSYLTFRLDTERIRSSIRRIKLRPLVPFILAYWGAPVEQLRAAKPPTLAEAITASWLEKFQQVSSDAKAGQLPETE